MKKLQQKPLPFHQALDLILKEAARFGVKYETVDLQKARNRVLAEEIRADSDKPACDNSSMDGFCVRSLDVQQATPQNPVIMPVAPGIDAGHPIEHLPGGHCAYIATGAPLPAGADAVEKLESIVQKDGSVIFTKPVKRGNFVRTAGSEHQKGHLIAGPGAEITPFLVAIAASCGLSSLKVCKKPVVGILASGDELVMHWETPKPWQIRNVNSLMLSQQICEAGATPVDFGIARDQEEDARKLFERAVDLSDIIVTSGGISMGRKDPFRNIFSELEIEPVVYGVTMKPGKPVFFGYYKDKPVFALPGNMVSTAVTFELFVRTFIRKAMKLPSNRLWMPLRLHKPSFNDSGRDFFERGQLLRMADELLVVPVENQESHMLSSFAKTDLLYLHPAEKHELPAGSQVECILLRNES
ncbi:MAG: gephyrin-like molybdotransferase Glp [Candidatus Rifleibacteriota bacterium]